MAKNEVSITVRGQKYAGTWQRSGKVLTVTTPEGRSMSSQLGGLSEEWLARDLMRAIVRDGAGQNAGESMR